MCLVAVSGLLAAIHVAGQFSRLYLHHGNLLGIVPLFNMEDESNIPTFWSSLLWVLAGGAAGLVALGEKQRADRQAFYWLGIALLSWIFATDEFVQLHERLGALLQSLALANGVEASGVFRYIWVIPGGLFAAAVAILYLRFLLTLQRDVAVTIAVAGALYLAGALGFEMLEGSIDTANGYMGPAYTLCVTCEETLEMIGVSLLIFAILKHAAARMPSIQIRVASIE